MLSDLTSDDTAAVARRREDEGEIQEMVIEVVQTEKYLGYHLDHQLD